MIPAFWFEQTVVLDEKIAKEAAVSTNQNVSAATLDRFIQNIFEFHFIRQVALELPTIGAYVAYGISGLGVILLIVGIVATVTKRWNSYENLDDELTTS